MRNGFGNLTQALLQMGGPSQAQTQVDLMGAQRDMQLAQALMQQQYVPNSGPLGAVTMLLGGLAGRNVQRGADERFSDALERQFAIEREQYARALEAQQAQEERAYQRDVQKIREREKAEQEFAPPQKPIVVGNRYVLDPNDPTKVLKEFPAEPRAPSEIDVKIQRAIERGATEEQVLALLLGNASGTPAKPPANYQWGADGRTAEPIRGGPADPSNPQALAKLERERLKKMQPLDDALAAYDELERQVTEVGTEHMPFTDSRASLLAAYTNARDANRVLSGTGVLNVGELPFLEQKLSDPTSYFTLSGSNVLAQIAEAKKLLEAKRKNLETTYAPPGAAGPPSGGGAPPDPLGIR